MIHPIVAVVGNSPRNPRVKSSAVCCVLHFTLEATVAYSRFHKGAIPLGLGTKVLPPAGFRGKTPIGDLGDENVLCLGRTRVTDSQFGYNRAYLTVSVICICLFQKLVASLPQESERIRTEYWYKGVRIVYLCVKCITVVNFTKHFTLTWAHGGLAPLLLLLLHPFNGPFSGTIYPGEPVLER